MTDEQKQNATASDAQHTHDQQSDTNNHERETSVDDVVVGVVETEEDVTTATTSDMQQRLDAAEKQASDYKDQWLRAVADYKNYKRRAEIERSELIRSASASLISKLLPILDDFERAEESVPATISDDPWWNGTKLIGQKIRTLLESEGVTPIAALGEEFDPNFHDAVLYEDAEGQDGKVIEELRKGYRLNDRVIRPTMVKVGRG